MYRKNNLIELILILVIIGFGSGIIGSLIGVGGGIIMSPVLTYMGFSPAVIASSSLIAVFATSISSTLTYIRKKYINYRLGVLLALPAIPGSIIGGFFSNFISLEYFKIYFAVLLTSVGLYIFNFSFWNFWCRSYIEFFWHRRRNYFCSNLSYNL
jgi:uncharacterized membrane protein YfcA